MRLFGAVLMLFRLLCRVVTTATPLLSPFCPHPSLAYPCAYVVVIVLVVTHMISIATVVEPLNIAPVYLSTPFLFLSAIFALFRCLALTPLAVQLTLASESCT